MKVFRHSNKRNQNIPTIAFLLGLIGLAIYFTKQWSDVAYNRDIFLRFFREIAFDFVLNPAFYLIIFIIFYLELTIPAKKEQKVFSIGMIQDLLWSISDTFFTIALSSPYILLLQSICQNHLSFLNIEIVSSLPIEFQSILSIFVSDFLLWFSHLLRHKVPIFWCFHAVHHSQKELNLFSDLRFHFVDSLITFTIAIIPLSILEIPLPTVAIYLLFQKWYLRLYHANIKTNYGWLKYIFVTPQSHRIHHSIEAKHYDLNFGSLFSIWDYLFKTQYKNYHEYPDTGIKDRNFPLEKSAKWQQLVKTYFSQLIYPFLLLLRSL